MLPITMPSDDCHVSLRASGGEGLLGDVSIVIPVAPGDRAWTALLPDLGGLSPVSEIILAAAELEPPEFRDAIAPGRPVINAVWIVSDRGRARQMNAGARRATRPFVWFLHADSRVSEVALMRLTKSIGVAPDALHFFDLAFLNDGPALMALNRCGTAFRSRLLKMPFGDQGFCLRRDLFRALGGYDENAAYGEDHLLVWTARRQGVKLRRVAAPLSTSARKYRERGWLSTTSRHVALTAWQAIPQWFHLVAERTCRQSPRG